MLTAALRLSATIRPNSFHEISTAPCRTANSRFPKLTIRPNGARMSST